MSKDSKHHGALRLLPFFLALSALTVGEVALYETWRQTQFVPKYVIVIIILALTLPKAAIVMIYFMHLRFEKLTLIVIALFPLVLVFIAVLTTLTDIRTINESTDSPATHNVESKTAPPSDKPSPPEHESK